MSVCRGLTFAFRDVKLKVGAKLYHTIISGLISGTVVVRERKLCN